MSLFAGSRLYSICDVTQIYMCYMSMPQMSNMTCEKQCICSVLLILFLPGDGPPFLRNNVFDYGGSFFMRKPKSPVMNEKACFLHM